MSYFRLQLYEISLRPLEYSTWGAPWHGPPRPWPTQKFGRVGHNAFGPPKIFTLLLCQNKERSRYINRSKQKRYVMNELQIFREQFDVMFDNAIINAQQLDLEEIQLPRRRRVRVPARIVEGSGEQYQFADVRSMKRSQFYEAVNTLTSTIDWRRTVIAASADTRTITN